MIEAEIKVEAIHDDVRPEIERLGAASLGDVMQTDVYYSAPHREFAETDEALRVRVEGDVAYVTYKGPKLAAGTKSRREIDLRVSSAEDASAMLRALGFEEYGRVEKHREEYAYGDFHVALDSVDGLGEYVEVETKVERDDVDAAHQELERLLADLGLDPGDAISTSYLEMLVAADETGW
ncbi:MAG: class IV adenylate cyclase [Halobacteriales archaeon]